MYVRRFSADPGNEVLLNIESVNILDLTPPASIKGVGSGTVLLLGEFENGPFAPQQVLGTSDFSNTWGTLGFQYGGLVAKYPSAPVRTADGGPVEYWNGNAFVQISGLTFAALIICRVNTSVGAVSFAPQAYVEGAVELRYALTTGQELQLTIDATTTATTFTGVPATVTGSGGFTSAGSTGWGTVESCVLAADGLPNFTVNFTALDQTPAQCCSRINSYAGFTLATVSSGQVKLTGQVPGLAGSVQVVSGAALTELGLTVATTAGTGNVQNIGSIAFSEINTLVQTASAGSLVELNAAGAIRISNTATPGTGLITIGAATTATGLGFTIGQTSTANVNPAGVLPAGTVVQTTGGTHVLVTMQDVVVAQNSAGPYAVPVRFAVDDGTGTTTAAHTIGVVANPPTLGSFWVDNTATINNAMTESQIDAAYVAALAQTTSVNSVTRLTNMIVSARQSNTIRSQLRANAIKASSTGSRGRVACISPPLNTSAVVALGNSAPGVAATRDERTIYCYVGANVYVPLIGKVGIAGGTGFNATGNVDVHSDVIMASICSQLPPEENPGQATTFTANVNGIETGANVQNFDMSSYQAFKAAGIAALRIDESVAVFQSGVTSVDPSVWPQLVRIARRRMDDFITDSIAGPAKAYGKKLSLAARRKALKGEIKVFMAGLLGVNNPGSQRIAGYTVSDSVNDGNDDVTLSSGMYRITVKAKTLSSLDSIVVQATIGDDVVVVSVLPVAA